MKIDVSEVKTFRNCKRQWMLSSRNRLHLRARVPASRFALGTLFHEALAQLYLGNPIEKVMTFIKKEMDPKSDVALLAMVPGYAREVLPGDMDHLRLLDIEHHFEFLPVTEDGEVIHPEITVVGSIDRIMIDDDEGTIYGFEDKTCRDFRNDVYLWMDEQPRVYAYALQQYTQKYNERKLREWEQRRDDEPCLDRPVPVRFGGIYMNEVKKLLRDFKYKRTLCTYSPEDLGGFMERFFTTCLSAYNSVRFNEPAAPSPSYFSCGMCDFKTICSTYMYTNPSPETIVKEFQDEFQVRTEDHLEEKAERSVTTDG